MNRLMYVAFAAMVLASCKGAGKSEVNGVPTAENLREEITVMDDSLRLYYEEIMDNKRAELPEASIEKTIQLHKRFYTLFPKDEFAPEAMDKVHQLYLQTNQYGKSVDICKELFEKYPSYKAINSVMYSAATTYDYMLRDTTQARVYYEKLLSAQKVSPETKKEIGIRLNYLGDSPEEMAEKISREVGKLLKDKAVNE